MIAIQIGRRTGAFLALLLVALLTSACGTVQPRVAERQAALGSAPKKANFL